MPRKTQTKPAPNSTLAASVLKNIADKSAMAEERKNRTKAFASIKKKIFKPYIDDLRFMLSLQDMLPGSSSEAKRSYIYSQCEVSRLALLYNSVSDLGFTRDELMKRMDKELKQRTQLQGPSPDNIAQINSMLKSGEVNFFTAKSAEEVLKSQGCL